MRPFIFFALIAVFLSCQSKQNAKSPEPQIDNKILITCDRIGEVWLKDSYADLEKRFGEQALSEHENTEAGVYTTVWDGDPKQVNIFWVEKKAPFKRIKFIETNSSMSPYMTRDSVQMGMSLRDLVKKNGHMAITFRNFYAEEQAGVIKTFNSGEITKTTPCLGGVLEWVKQTNIYVDEHKAFQKKEELESFDKLLQRMEVQLSAIRVSAKQ